MKIDELRLADREIRDAMRKAMEEGQLYGDDGDPLPEKGVAEAQISHIQYLADKKRKIIAFIPEVIAVSSEDIIEVEI